MKTLLLTLAALTLFVAPAFAEVTITHPAYAFKTAPQQMNGAAFFTLSNSGAETVTITAASSDIANMTELHTVSKAGGIMEMREAEGLTIPAGGELSLEPTGDHVMLMGLTSQLELDTTFPVTLTFANGDTLELPVKVVEPGFTHEKEAHDHDHSHH